MIKTSDQLSAKEWLALNAKLQQKKNTLRKMLKEKGVLKREAQNSYDRYKYFSEAQYKELFTGLFADCNLELKFNEISYDTYTGTEKQANGRMPKLEFTLMDVETGFGESTVITGEGMDKGDKAGYKAYTGALKYYLANTFMVANGDDPEKDSPDAVMNTKEKRQKAEPVVYITEKEQTILKNMVESMGYTIESTFNKPLSELTYEEYYSACKAFDLLKEKEEKKKK